MDLGYLHFSEKYSGIQKLDVYYSFKSKHGRIFSIIDLQKVSGNRESSSSIQLQRETEKRQLPL